MATANILVPRNAIRAGDVILLKTIISHPMETGYRRNETGGEIPRNIIRRMICRYDGQEVFSVEMHQAIAANPFMAFSLVATKSGPVEIEWVGDHGFSHRQSAQITVTG
ncbi:MAG: thiosulfate oxidation carrier complex protein SoxZ [Methylobacterium sp.]|nr:MAG: thiosulfate oxidation carrier complex protein SoxZ [Methylobacterium sp.]